MITVRVSMVPVAQLGDLEGGWLTRYKKRRNRRWRKYKAERRARMRRVRRRWRNFWKNWWHLIATIVHRIGTLIVTWFVPVLGKYLGQYGQKYLDAARNAQARIKQNKALGHAALETFRSYMEAAPDGVAGVIERISGKYGTEFQVPAELRPVMQQLLNDQRVKQIMALEDKVDDLPDDSPAADAIEAQIDDLEEGKNGVLDDLVSLEQALDTVYWQLNPPRHKAHPKGSPKYKKYKTLDEASWGKLIDVWIAQNGDLWVRWKESAAASAPKGTEEGVWYRVTGNPLMSVIASETPELQQMDAATAEARTALLAAAQEEQQYMTRMGIKPMPTHKGLPGWAWASIGVGGVAIATIVVVLLTSKGDKP